MRALTLAMAGLIQSAAPAITPISPPTPVPVLLRPDAVMDACPSTVRPKLPPGGLDGFLSLRAGPGVAWPEVARLHPADLMFECDNGAGWAAVIVQPPGGGNCGVSTPVRRLQRYTGPCRQGWVSTRLIETVAG